jgi:Man1-Src1p-C-terminal domain
MLALFAAAYGRSRFVDYRQATAQIPTLVNTTLDRLATQAALAADGRVDEGFISIGQLRDDVLRATFSAAERERVWKGVRAIVEGNANVRASTREAGRTGEMSRVWEWIGPVNLAPGLEGRRSAGLIEEQPPSTGGGRDGTDSGSKEMVESRKWDEGRPIY